MNRFARRAGIALGVVVGVVVVSAAAVYGVSESRLHKQYTVAAKNVGVPTDSASVARGEHLASSLGGCRDCHGQDLAGKMVIDNPALGQIAAPNLTRGKGGYGSTLTDSDYVRAIRHGVDPTGRGLVIMPSSDFDNFSDSDLAAIIAYVKSVPAVDKTQPAVALGPVGRALLAAKKLPLIDAETIEHGRVHLTTVSTEPSVEYGSYLAAIGCKGCHGPQFAGGKIAHGAPDWPPAANLTPAGSIKSWSEEGFGGLLRTGKRPDGSAVNPAMPVSMTKNLTDAEIHSIWVYLKSLPAAATPKA